MALIMESAPPTKKNELEIISEEEKVIYCYGNE